MIADDIREKMDDALAEIAYINDRVFALQQLTLQIGSAEGRSRQRELTTLYKRQGKAFQAYLEALRALHDSV